MSNHSGNDSDSEFQKMFDKRLAEFATKPGPTGRFPEGKLTPSDEGEIAIAITHAKGKVLVDFGKPTAWVGFPPAQARAVANAINEHANEIDDRAPVLKTAAELRQIIATELSNILGNNITTEALDVRRTNLQPSDVLANVHLFERLGVAYEAIKALKGYTGEPRGFIASSTNAFVEPTPGSTPR